MKKTKLFSFSRKEKNDSNMPNSPQPTTNLADSLLSENTEDQILANFDLPPQETSPIVSSPPVEPEPPELGQNITALTECLQKLTSLQTSQQQLSEQNEQLLTIPTQLNTLEEKVERINTKFTALTDLETNLNAALTSRLQQLKNELERLPNHPDPTAASIHTEIEEAKILFGNMLPLVDILELIISLP
jgi:peptidoglycan hydrolase CwlO-like protein